MRGGGHKDLAAPAALAFPKLKPIRLDAAGMKKLRQAVFLRDQRCVDCGSMWWLELSHDIPRSLGGSDTERNCHVRCKRCHIKRDGHGEPMHF